MAAQRNVQKKKSKRKNTRRQNQDGHPRSEAPFLKEAPISSAVAEALRAEAAAPTDHGALEEPEASAPKECLTSDASAQTDAKPAAVTAAAERPAETPAGELSKEEKADERSAIVSSPETDLTEGVDAVSGRRPEHCALRGAELCPGGSNAAAGNGCRTQDENSRHQPKCTGTCRNTVRFRGTGSTSGSERRKRHC